MVDPSAAPLEGESASVRLAGPAGRIPVGLRIPWSAPPPSADERRREEILKRTHFDVAWGIPPDRTGLTWDSSRSVYKAAPDIWGAAYRDIGLSEGKYPQAYKGTGSDAWQLRWVYVHEDPYRILPSNEAHALYLKVLAEQQYLRGSEPQSISGGTERTIREPIFPITPIGQAPTKQPNLGDFAWVEQQHLPPSCPYPYPYLPVPQADYVSGRWLEPDYVPSIPLPYPYSETPWRCGHSAPLVTEKGKAERYPLEHVVHGREAIPHYTVPAEFLPGLPAPTGPAAPVAPAAQVAADLFAAAAEIASLFQEAEELKKRLDKASSASERAQLQRDLRAVKEKAAPLTEEARRLRDEYLRGHEGETLEVPTIREIEIPVANDDLAITVDLSTELRRGLPLRSRTRADLCLLAADARQMANEYSKAAATEVAKGAKAKGSRMLKKPFLETQARILEKLCSSGITKVNGKDDGQRMDWLVRLLEVFQGSLRNHMLGKMPYDPIRAESDFQYVKAMEIGVAEGHGAGSYWNGFDDALDGLWEAKTQNPSVDLSPLYPGMGSGTLAIDVPADLIAGAAMAYRHIMGDLKIALLTQGTGLLEDWKWVGETVRVAQDEVIGPTLLEFAGRLKGFDPQEWRDQARADAGHEILGELAASSSKMSDVHRQQLLRFSGLHRLEGIPDLGGGI
jgi:hypothetical protein